MSSARGQAKTSRSCNIWPFRLKDIITIVCLLVFRPAFAWVAKDGGIKRLYVEAFITKQGTEKLQADIKAELQKLKCISLVSKESDADLILGGGGEIWVRGYRSFSPRSHMKLPTNGTPIYGGYLSVELKNKYGVTVWSYLVTPGTPSGDISKDLSKEIAKHLAEGLNQAESATTISPRHEPAVSLAGAGATFPYPVYKKWFTNFQVTYPGTAIVYDAIGSEAGVRKLLAGSVDFGASDSPEAVRDLAPRKESDYLLFPSVVGAVVPIVNLPGVSDDIAFTPEALAGIYLGKIRKWNDPILQRANRGLHLPDLDIVVVHRADGSGTSYAWTDYLSKISPEWRASVGSSLAPKWPIGRGAIGNDGVAKLVKELGGSIGYVEFIYALQNHLTYGRVRNRNGEFVEASLASIETAVDHSARIHEGFKASIVDAPGDDAYPIASFTWIIVPIHIADDKKRDAITAFLRWMLGPGQRQAAALGYVALPGDVVANEENAIVRIH
jgi:phosphate transport system substrate-binding protein